MKRLALLVLATCALRLAAAEQVYVLPVVTAKVGDRVYTTTLAARNDGTVAAACEAIYAIPNDPQSGTLRGAYRIPAGSTQVEPELLREAGAVGTLRLVCSEPVVIAARIQASSDGGATFDTGRVYAAIPENDTIVGRRRFPVTTDLVVAEVRGKSASFEAVAIGGDGAELGRKIYSVPAFAQQIVNLSVVRSEGVARAVEIRLIGGGGALVAAEESRDAVILAMTRPGPQATVSRPMPSMSAPPTGSSPINLVGAASFKALPFVEPMTGLVYSRDRWYDPRSGAFMSPDPEGYADSANAYSYCGGDPVNCSDPTGRMGDGGDLREHFRQKEQAELRRRHRIWCEQNPVACSKSQVRAAAVVKALGAGGQIVAGAATFTSSGPLPEPLTKTLGGVTMGRGFENLGTAGVEIWTGEPHETPTGYGLYLLLRKQGKSPAEASKISGWVETGVDLGTTLASSAVPAINTALRLRPVGGIINVGGTGEVANATNLNPVIGETGGQTRNIPNLVRDYADNIGERFVPGSAKQVIANRLPGFNVNWDGFARGAYSALEEGGTVSLNVYVTGPAAEQAALRAAAVRAFQQAGFKNVSISGENVGTILRATR